MKKIFLCAWLLGAISYQSVAQQKTSVSHHTVNPGIVSAKGIVSQKILLSGSSTPQVKLINIKTEPVDQLPANVQVSNSFEPDVIRGIERKQQVAFAKIPAFRKSGTNLERLVSFDLEVTEFEDGTSGHTAQKPTTVPNSVLASGNWYKIGAPTRGVYKIDYAFLQSIGANPASINPANIRVYGNGGTVLPEKVTPDQPDDLIENAIYVSSNGSTFGQNDYILFYANGPVLWNKDSVNKTFTHTSNYYENQSYYFLNFDLGAGKRITTEAATGASSYTATTFDDYTLIERDSFNLGNMGKVWWGNKMNSMNSATLTQNFNVNLGAVVGNVGFKTSVSNVGDAGASIAINYNNNFLTALNMTASGGNIFMDPVDYTGSFPSGGNLTLSYSYNTGGTAAGYIDYIRLNYRKQLTFPSGQLAFRDWNTAALPAGQNAEYTVQNANANLKVWEITDPLNPTALNGTLSSNNLSIVRPGNRLREFIAFDGSQFNAPVKLGISTVPNQDLHGLSQVDFLIVTPPEFRAAAEELAAFHRQKEGMTVAVAQTDQIYNEFSSGGQDIGGIRNFIKMFYDRTGTPEIRNVLFMGAASFDYKNRIAFNTNFVPTFQTYESANSSDAYSSDDFFALLDEGEDINCTGSGCSNRVDIGTGRIPAFDADEANKAIVKIKNYASPASFGPWKNVVSYVADDKDAGQFGMNHMKDCETVSNFYYDSAHVLNVYKIYSDAYVIASTPSGGRYPMVNKAINDQIYNGTFLMSYSGHGSPQRWSHEAILTADDYGNWTNKNKLPVMVTATCDFGRFDDPSHRSAGAKLMINPNSGSIAMITTTQVVYQFQNTALNEAYTAAQFTKDAAGNWKTIGEALREAKNRFADENNYKYVVLGDPALKMEMPVHNVVTDKLEMQDIGSTFETDTIKALGRYLLSGSITDKNNNLLSNFNGPVYVTIFDKIRKVQTVNPEQTDPYFNLQTNIVAKVKGTVKNGKFTVSFVAPKDINYDYGLGKISYYANSESTDAAGVDTSYTIGDYNHNAVADNDAPIVKPYIDNDKFRNGGVTGPNPLLYVKLYDDNGINVSGSSIGHDLVAILDEDLQNPYIMNNYYESEQNDYRNGHVNFPLYNLPEGQHTLRVKAWDAYNNSGEGTVTFEVKNKDKGFISDIYNYPNPVTDVTHIVFQHNQEGEEMDVTLQIFNASGALARTLKQNIVTTGNRTEILWDGLGENGTPLFRGVYFYRLTAKTSKGISATAYQKLVLLR
ncbi:MAG: type IX secretion system sortase PorU [Taibaiella sp.]|jgi:hypothetical protein